MPGALKVNITKAAASAIKIALQILSLREDGGFLSITAS